MSVSGFAHPWSLLLLVVVAALVAGYLLVLRRRRRNTMRFTNLALLERVAPERPRWTRHLPVGLLLVSLVLLVVALAGPTGELKVPRNRATVMLAIDVSLSMQATDVEPTRLQAAQAAAKSFTDGLTPGVNLGLISFAGTATVLMSPTTERKPVDQAVDGLKLAESTATGEAIYAAMQSIDSFAHLLAGPEGPPPSRIVLMSDGKQTVGRDAFDAARAAGQAKVPISTISFGTDYGEIELQGQPQPVAVDDASMREIAKLSGGDFYKAASVDELKQVYATLGEQIGYETKKVDASRPWLALGTLGTVVALGVAFVLGQRLP